jgi:phosphoglycerol transferase MdoB-like AlkP superfamily enzyme
MAGIKTKAIFNAIIQRTIKYMRAGFLVFMLALLFSYQNHIFNVWLGIKPNLYFLRQFLVTFALGLILYSPALLFKKRGRYIYLFLISLIVSSLFIIQFSYYEYSQNFLQVSAIKYANQLYSVTGTIKTLINFNLLFFATNIILVALALFISVKKKYRETSLSILEKIAFILLIILFTWFSYNYLLKTEIRKWGNASRLYADSYDLNTLVGKVGIVNFSIEDIIKYLSRNKITDADKTFLADFVPPQRDPARGGTKYFGIAKGKNLIIIQVESLDDAVLFQKIAGQEITPNLNQLANQGLYFSNYYADVFSGNTADTEFTTMDSLYALADDVVFIDYAQNKYAALPATLKKNGYHTYVFHGDVPSFWNRSNVYPQLGYDKAFDLDEYVVTRPVGQGPSNLGDEDLFLQSLPKLEKLKQPFLATVITISSHTPFILPDDLNTLQIPDDTNLNQTQQNYLESVHYTDKAIGEFIDGLKKDGLYDNSVIAIYGDHESYTNVYQPLGTGVADLPGLAGSHIPLIVLVPGSNPKEEIATPGSHLDFFPTMANLLGIVLPKSVLGQDILNTKTPVVVKQNSGSGRINTILTNDLAFEATDEGVFNMGTCLKMPEKNPLPVADCQTLYNQQNNTIRASNIVIRGDLINYLK